mmetsp:Transcript_5857/g.11996  ORF Transcript_5857/g.11996 Transcript_5857/m.11996 type:complete len:210 (+) Transcript_5857:1762-2391(+)
MGCMGNVRPRSFAKSHEEFFNRLGFGVKGACCKCVANTVCDKPVNSEASNARTGKLSCSVRDTGFKSPCFKGKRKLWYKAMKLDVFALRVCACECELKADSSVGAVGRFERKTLQFNEFHAKEAFHVDGNPQEKHVSFHVVKVRAGKSRHRCIHSRTRHLQTCVTSIDCGAKAQCREIPRHHVWVNSVAVALNLCIVLLLLEMLVWRAR